MVYLYINKLKCSSSGFLCLFSVLHDINMFWIFRCRRHRILIAQFYVYLFVNCMTVFQNVLSGIYLVLNLSKTIFQSKFVIASRKKLLKNGNRIRYYIIIINYSSNLTFLFCFQCQLHVFVSCNLFLFWNYFFFCLISAMARVTITRNAVSRKQSAHSQLDNVNTPYSSVRLLKGLPPGQVWRLKYLKKWSKGC